MQLKAAFIGLLLGILQTSSNPVQFKVPGIEVTPDNTIELPVSIHSNGNTIGSMEFELRYDQSILEFSQIKVTEKAQQWLTYTMDTGNGRVRWGGYDQTHGKYSINTATEVFRVTFKVLDRNWTTTPITVGRKRAGDKLGWDLSVQNTDGYVNMAKRAIQIEDKKLIDKVYPVPSKDYVTAEFVAPTSTYYSVKVYSASGNLVRLRDVFLKAGTVKYRYDIQDLPEGFYLLNITNNTFARTFKIIKN